MGKKRLISAVAAVAVSALVLAACGSSSDSGSSSGTTTASGGSSSGLQLSEPVKVALLWEVKGESAQAIDDYQNGATMAIEAINAAGGIGGQPIEATRISAPPLDPQKTTAAYLSALDGDPVAVIGFTSSAQLLPAITNVERSGTPLIATTSGDEALAFGGSGGSEWSWIMNVHNDAITETTATYMVDELKLSRIGLMGTNEAYGTSSIAGSVEALDALGKPPVAERTYAPTATDLTEQVLAMKEAGVDGVMNWGFPNPLAVQLKQFRQNGLDIPTFSGGSAPIVVNNKLAEGDAISKFYSVIPCNPPGTSNTNLQAFNTAYQSKYGAVPGNLAALAHDAIYVLKAAIEKAGSVDREAVNTAIGEVDVTQGVVCARSYQADEGHYLGHELGVVSWAADGSSQTVKTYEVAPSPRANG